MKKNKVIILKDLPKFALNSACFTTTDRPVKEPMLGEVLIKVKLISIDAANRAWLNGPTYRPAVSVGDIMPAYGIGEVVKSRSKNLNKGDLVSGELEWSEYTTKRAIFLKKVDGNYQLTDLLTYKGIAGLTAYHGLLNVAKIEPKETVLVSTAAGSVGIFACQIARILGCKVIGLSSSDEKCDWVEKNLGIDKCINYKGENFSETLKEICPEGIDVYFDNVGGNLLEQTLYRMRLKGRVVCCGAISQYDQETTASPKNIPGVIVTKRLKLEGFIVMDFQKENFKALEDLSKWFEAGQLKVFTEEYKGLDNAPLALINLLKGKNLGKTIIKI